MQDSLLNRNLLARMIGILGLPIFVVGGFSAKAGPVIKNHIDPWSVSVADVEIRGRITGEDGVALPGASILIKSTTRGTITDADGNFKLNIAEDAGTILVVSLVGYVSQEVVV